jgi:transcriptional regulator with GAF, ATPase, and Fis domain
MSTTTHPSASTGHKRLASRPERVRWVFPKSVVTPRLEGPHVVGRDPSCDSVLTGTEISRRHAELVVNGPVLAIRNLESRNGVFVNGERREDTALEDGDVVRCGEWIGVVTSGPDSEFGEIATGWHGGSALASAVEPARRLPSDLPIIIQGETGTGKEGMARAIHVWSGRHGPFIAVNCAAIPSHLAEAELFGYRKGAFTGAEKASVGLFRAAHGGTLFLDEVLDLPAAVQPKLLRAIEQREVLSLGETTPTSVDVRIVAATQEPLASAVVEKRFRADLHARLDGLTVVLPPLRERREDIVPLFRAFLHQHSGGRPPALEPKLVEALTLYDWPLNVRELLLLARRLLGVHGTAELLKKIHLPERMTAPPSSAAAPAADLGPTPADGQKTLRRKVDDEAEFEALVGALRAQGGSVAKAAASIGVSRARAYRVLSAHPEFALDPTDP